MTQSGFSVIFYDSLYYFYDCIKSAILLNIHILPLWFITAAYSADYSI